METSKARRAWNNVQDLNDHGCQPRLLYPAKLCTTVDGEEKKSVHDTKKLKEFMSGKTSLSENTGKNSQVG